MRFPQGAGGWFAFLTVCLMWSKRSEPKQPHSPTKGVNEVDEELTDEDFVPWKARDTALETYYAATATVSTIVRQLAFVGIAVVWLFSGVDVKPGSGLDIPPGLLKPGVLLIATLVVDLLQYVFRTFIWGVWHWKLHRRNNKDCQLAPTWFNWPTLALFCTKIALIGAAYVLLGCYLFQLMP